ncbi:DUF2272 domain-containing protein [Lysobacter tyrosinilyticus]
MGSGSGRKGWSDIVSCRAAAAIGLLALARVASAGNLCERIPQSPPSYASRIALLACSENAMWYGPFIDAQGRLASITVAESERLRLQDGSPAWQRVADYWKGSGLLGQMAGYPGASDCSFTSAPAGNGHLQSASCRAFLTDTPWSAAFVSYVLTRAGLPGFTASAGHMDFIRAAYRHPDTSPYVLSDPDSATPAAGDLLCFARGREPIGAQGLRDFLASGNGNGLNMHCDIVIAANPDDDSHLYLVGGNVLQGVTLRVLPLNRNGVIWGLPRRTGLPADCLPDNESMCSFNRQDWVALLKLKPLPAPSGMPAVPEVPTQPQCCTQCPLPMPADLQRCPLPPIDAQPPSGG